MSTLLEIITVLLGGTSIIGVVQAVRYRKENKSLKEAEAKAATIANQSEQIDLGSKYLESIMDMSNKLQSALGEGHEELKREIVEVKDELKKNSEKLDMNITDTKDIIEFLNGEFQEYRNSKCRKAIKKAKSNGTITKE